MQMRGIYEPSFAMDDHRVVRLEYVGEFRWQVMESRRIEMNGWIQVVRGDINALTSWARAERSLGGEAIVRGLGLRVKGTWWERVRAIRPDARVIGKGLGRLPAGSGSPSGAVAIRVYADPNPRGGVTIWKEQRARYMETKRTLVAADVRSRERAEEAVEAAGDGIAHVEYDDLASLFDLLDGARAAMTNLVKQGIQHRYGQTDCKEFDDE